ncbi:MAG: hypothetical protein WDN04_01225 [Rhodospirillales bacterium]
MKSISAYGAYGGGVLADHIGRANVMLISWVAFALSCLMLCAVETGSGLFGVVLFYGTFSGLAEAPDARWRMRSAAAQSAAAPSVGIT